MKLRHTAHHSNSRDVGNTYIRQVDLIPRLVVYFNNNIIHPARFQNPTVPRMNLKTYKGKQRN